MAASWALAPEQESQYYRARYYDPRLGRFLSEDPALGIDGPNLYSYVKNNPTNSIDPLGLFSFDDGLYTPGLIAGVSDTKSSVIERTGK